MRKIYISLLVLALVGCQSMPKSVYNDIAWMNVQNYKCKNAGYITPQLYGETRNALGVAANSWWDYDPDVLQGHMDSLAYSFAATSQTCREFEAQAYTVLAEFRNRQARKNVESTYEPTVNTPVYCSTIGSMTMCN